MSSATELIAQQFAAAGKNKAIWGDVIVNVRDFKAKGDGSDDTKAIQDAVNAAIALHKREVWFPSGTYTYTTLTNTDGIVFVGDGVTLNGTTVIPLVSVAQLADNAKHLTDSVNVKAVGAKGDGVTNDTAALQSAINNYSCIYIPDGVYYFTQLTITKSIKIIFSNNVALKTDYNLADATQGYFNILGSITANAYTIQQDILTLDTQFVLTPSASTNFSIGDIIELSQDKAFPADSSVTTEEQHRQQHGYAVMKVKSVDTSTGIIEVYGRIPYDLKTTYNAVVKKVNAVQNVEIIGSNTQFDNMGLNASGNFFQVTYGHNITISGFHCFNGAGKAIELYKSNQFQIEDMKYSKPTSQETAKGEAIHISKTGSGTIERCYIYDSRRGVDFSNAWGCLVSHCTAYQGRFTTHGLLAKFITFDNCIVYGKPDAVNDFYGLTVGNTDYMYDESISFNNCFVYGGFYGIGIVAKSRRVSVNNCYFSRNNLSVAITDSSDVVITDMQSYDSITAITLTDAINVTIDGAKIKNSTNIASSSGAIRVAGISTDILFGRMDVSVNRTSIITLTTTTSAKIKLMNSKFFNATTSGQLYLADNIDGFEMFNVETNNKLRLNGQTNIIIQYCKIFSATYGAGTAPTKNFNFTGNTLTGVSGVAPFALTTNAALNIFVQNNMYLFNV